MNAMPVERIYLVGFMGAGKSTVGRELSLKLHWSFLDLDTEIEKAEKLAVREIFARFGEPHFRQLERDSLKRLSAARRTVIALGGGTFIDEGNRAIVNETGVSVWLKTAFATVKNRIRPDGSRPLMSDPVKAKQLYEARLPSYKLARIHVLTDNRLPGELAEEIVRKVTAL
jgi:shikimate kinase